MGCAAGALAVLLSLRGSPAVLATQAPQELAIAPIETSEWAERYQVAVSFEQAEPPRLVSQGSGVVTSVDLVAGEAVDAGAVLMTVDDRPIIAFTSSAPLYRDLADGDHGLDVERLETFLADLGVLDQEPDELFDNGTADAVESLFTGLGSANVRMARAADFLWIPEDYVTGDVLVRVGMPLVSGSDVAVGGSQVSRIYIDEPHELPAGAQGKLSVGAATVDYLGGAGPFTDPEIVGAIVDGVSPSAVAAGGATGTVSIPMPRAQTIPTTALLQGADGGLCVYPDGSSDPVPVELVGGAGVYARISPVDGLGTVVVNPDLIPGAACDS